MSYKRIIDLSVKETCRTFSGEMCNKFKNVTHCIFDMDGLLLDTELLYTQAMQNVLARYDKEFTWEVKAHLMGMRHTEVCRYVVDTYDLPITPEEYSKIQSQENESIMLTAQFMPDTEYIYESIVSQISKSFGKQYPLDLRLKVLGTTIQNTARIVVNDLKLPISQEEFSKKYHQLAKEQLCNIRTMAGAERLLCHLHANKVPMCLATSSPEDLMKLKTNNHREIFNLLNHYVCGSTDPEVKEGKPAPDIFLIAASRFPDKPKPEQCLVFEDSPNGVKAAHCANMQVVMVPDERISLEDSCLATIRLKSLLDFQPELFGLPGFKD